MRARDLAEPFPVVNLDTDAMDAARLLGTKRLPGLIVCGSDGRPYAVLPGSQVLRFIIPDYVQEDLALARVFDEEASDELLAKLTTSTVRDVLPNDRDVDELPIVDHDATTIEVAAVMARMHSPIVAVVEGDELLGAITVGRLLNHLLPSSPATP
jgi:predicted transcriptional regulator